MSQGHQERGGKVPATSKISPSEKSIQPVKCRGGRTARLSRILHAAAKLLHFALRGAIRTNKQPLLYGDDSLFLSHWMEHTHPSFDTATNCGEDEAAVLGQQASLSVCRGCHQVTVPSPPSRPPQSCSVCVHVHFLCPHTNVPAPAADGGSRVRVRPKKMSRPTTTAAPHAERLSRRSGKRDIKRDRTNIIRRKQHTQSTGFLFLSKKSRFHSYWLAYFLR